ncbi:MAG: 50S ribosomal protein L20 [Bacteriovoracaceae bacterium]
MTRVRKGFKGRRRKNRVLKQAKGFHFDRRTKFKHALETVRRALHYAYKGRRLLKRDMRKLWITRINAAANSLGVSYSQLIGNLAKKGILLNRKVLSEMAIHDPAGFKTVVEAAR